MGQVALGFRSLLIKVAVFFVMAALLAWALGGTLWPRAEIVDRPAIGFDGREWFWRLTVGGRERGSARWMLMERGNGLEPLPVDGRTWSDVAGPVAGAGAGALFYGGLEASSSAHWRVERIPRADNGGAAHASMTLPDRLAVELQLERAAAGLALLEPEEIERRRQEVVNEPAARDR